MSGTTPIDETKSGRGFERGLTVCALASSLTLALCPGESDEAPVGPERPPTKPEARWHFPLGSGRAVITSCFGPRALRGRTGRHGGLDLRAAEHTFVEAIADGRVSRAGVEPEGWGSFVELRHPRGWVSLYAHLSEISVRRGQVLRRGDRLGYAGSSGRSFGPHLHLEVRRHGRRLDPLAVISCSSRVASVVDEVGCPTVPPACPGEGF